ncbi:Rho GTPase activation protein [Martensiomyces pterosporus]|nr:Rho GTPase activation protein [Martensiomyces pterosporus]
MHGCLDTPALSDKTTARILKAGVLYLRMHDTGELLKPVPHALVEDSDWQPYMAILAQCGGLVSLFLYDVDESMAVEVAEIEVQQLVVGDIHADDDSLFSSSFGFHESDIGASTSSDVGMFTNHRNSFLTESVYTSTHSMASGSSIKSCRRSIGSGASRSTMDQGSTDMAVAGSKLMSSSLSTHGQILPGDIVMHALEEEDDRAVEANAGTAKGVHPGKPRSKSLDSPPNLYDHSIYSDSRQAASQSILPHHALFPVNTPPVLYFAALRASDRNDWIAFAQQDYSGSVPLPIASTVATELAFRVERSMWIKIFEVQGLSKVCDVTAMLIIDGLPLAQTEVQAQTNAPKWDSAAYFFSGLPQITHGAHVLVRHHEQQSGTTGGLLGYCYIPIPLLRRKHIYDGWYPLTYGELSDVDGCASMYLPLAVNVKPSSRRSCRNRLSVSNIIESVAAPSMPFRSGDVHMQVRYDELVVLTAPFYKDTTSLMFVIEPALVFDLVAVLPKSADWLVETMTKIALRKRQFVPWIEAVIKHELECQGVHDPALLFRGASVTTRAIDTFMKAVGLAYADQMIGDVVRDVASAEYKCEVDPARLQPGECAADHWQTLVLLQRLLWGSIEDSVHCCPDIMRQVFSRIRAAVALHFSKADPQVRYSCISGFIFLRLICPAMLSPKSFGIVDRQPPVPSLRALTLMAKGIQCAANLTDFAMKEPYMQPMNAFVQECTPKLKQFIDYVATAPGADPSGDSNPKPNSLFVDEAIMAIDEERETAALCAFIHSSRDVLAQAMEVHSPLPKTPRSAQRHAKNKERLADPPEVAADSDNSNITDLPQPAEGRTSEPVTSPTTDLPKLGPVQSSMPKIQNLIHLKSLIRACGAVHDCVNACMESKYAPAVSVPARRKGSD